MAYEIDHRYLNQLFVESAREKNHTKLAQAGELFLRTRIREAPFWRKILPPVPVTKEDCQRSLDHDTLTIIKDIAPEAEAVSLTFRGRPNMKYIKGKRYEIPFYKISSPMYTKTEAELLAYEMPIVTFLEEDIVKVIMKEEDRNFMIQVDAALATTGFAVPAPTATGRLTKQAMIALFNILESRELECATILMNKETWNEWSGQGNEVFDIGAWDVARFGYKEETILGRKCIVTLKNDLVKYNHVYAFTAPEFLGHGFTLEDAKFWVDSRAEEMFFKGWEYLGAGIGNIRSIAKIEVGPVGP